MARLVVLRLPERKVKIILTLGQEVMFAMHKPLEGIRVLEWGIYHAGPCATAILADMGAEVIKIEQPGTGDPNRQLRAYKNIDFSLPGGTTVVHEGANRGKKSLTLNLAHQKGKQIAHNLVKKSDIFFTNLRRSTVSRMQMDYSTLSRVNPQLIYASVTSYGTSGPDADGGGFDTQGMARAGMMYAFGEPDMLPVYGQFAIVDQVTAIMASYQMVIALFMRDRFGIGQEVDVSLLGTASYMLYVNNLTTLLTGSEIPRFEQASADPMRNYYRCQDGKWIFQNQPPGNQGWETMCQIVGHPELVDDPRYNSREKRLESSRELVKIFDKAFATKPRDEWLRIFREKELVIAAINTITEALNDPQVIANDYVVDFKHPNLGDIRIPGFPMHFSQAEINNTLVAPKLGEHTDGLLKEIGGYSEEEIAQFRDEKVI
jgi:crotonobetainyl-CoA:carnitine CoA-transferase CaiB-like acyl-CoA transferase